MIWKHVLFINKERLGCLFFYITNICGILTGSPSKIGFLKIFREFREKLRFSIFSRNQKIHYFAKSKIMSEYHYRQKPPNSLNIFIKFHLNFSEFHKVLINGKMLQFWTGDDSVHYIILPFFFFCYIWTFL